MTPAETELWKRQTAPPSTYPRAAADLRALGFDPAAVDALDVLRVFTPLHGEHLPPPGPAWLSSGRRFFVALFDRHGAEAGIAAFPRAESAPGLVFADRGGLTKLRVPGGHRSDLVVAEGLAAFLRAALSPVGTPRTLGVVTAADWTEELGARIATRARRIIVAGSADLASTIRETCGSLPVELAEGSAS